MKIATPSEKSHPPLSQYPLSKRWGPAKPPSFLKIWLEAQPPPLPPLEKEGGTHYKYTAFNRIPLLHILPSSLLAGVLDLLLVKYDFLNILDFCFSRIENYFLWKTTAEVGSGTPPAHNIEPLCNIQPLKAVNVCLKEIHLRYWKESLILKYMRFHDFGIITVENCLQKRLLN